LRTEPVSTQLAIFAVESRFQYAKPFLYEISRGFWGQVFTLDIGVKTGTRISVKVKTCLPKRDGLDEQQILDTTMSFDDARINWIPPG